MLSFVVGLCTAATGLSAQSLLELPATAAPQTELADYALYPLMQPESRVQMFYDSTEVGSTSFTADRLELRYDGPIPQVGHPGPFAIQRLQLRIGTTAVALPGARFDDNLSQPLTTVFDGPWTYLPDPGSAFPHPWGGPSGTLTFVFSTPAPITIPVGGWLVVDLVMEGNNISNFGFAHAILDGVDTTGGPVNGTAQNYGQGCPPGAGLATPTIGNTGVMAPGAAHFVTGSELGANAPVFAIFGLSNTISHFGPLPFHLTGTSCSFLASIEVYSLLFADAAGTIAGAQAAAAIAVPADNAFAGLKLYEQLAAFAPGANPYDVALSDGLEVTLGSIQAPSRGTYAVTHDASATDPIATGIRAFGYAMRLRTL